MLYVLFVLQSVFSYCSVLDFVQGENVHGISNKVYFYDYDLTRDATSASSFIVDDDDDDDKRRFVLLVCKRCEWPRETCYHCNISESDIIKVFPVILFFSDASPPFVV